MKTRLYFAYGSNLNIGQMRRRAPDARPICELMLKNWKLVFRGVADVVQEHGAVCPGGVWEISEADEHKLDLYEGVKGGLYRKVYLPIATFRGHTSMLMYVMNSDGIFPPSKYYLEGIEEGYGDFRLGKKARKMLDAAVQESWDEKRPTVRERERSYRCGYPTLARPRPAPSCPNCGFCPRKPKPIAQTEPEQFEFLLDDIDEDDLN